MTTVTNTEIANNELICPITLEIIRDPVIARDEHVYEREAITKWILRSGRSPLTRQALKVNELEKYDPLKHVAAQRPNPTVSYNTHLDKVTVSSLPSISLDVTQPQAEQSDSIVGNDQTTKVNCKPCLNLLLSLFIISILIIAVVGGVLSRQASTNDPPKYVTHRTWTQSIKPHQIYSVSWSNALTTHSKKFVSKENDEIYYYQEIKIIASFKNIYNFESNSTIPLCAYLYNKSFTGDLYENLLRYDEDLNGDGRFHISYYLQFHKTYILIVKSRYANTTGPFNIIVTSSWFPARLAFIHNNFK